MHVHLISFQPLKLKIYGSFSLSRAAEPPLKHKTFQEQFFQHFPPGKQGDLNMEPEWWDSAHQGELKQRLASRVWLCGEIVSLFWLPGVLPSIQTVPHALAAAPAGPASPEVIFLQVLVPPVRDLGPPPSLAQP